LAPIDAYFEEHAATIKMLPQHEESTEVDPKFTLPVHKISVPPVAPLKVRAAGWKKVNADLQDQHLAAFVQGASDTECVRAARRVIKEAVKSNSQQVKGGAAKPKKQISKTMNRQLQERANQDLQAHGALSAGAAIEAEKLVQAAAIPDAEGHAKDGDGDGAGDGDFSPGEEYNIEGMFGVCKLQWLDAAGRVDSFDVYVGVKWGDATLVTGEDTHVWQRLHETFDDDEDVLDEVQACLDKGETRVLVKWKGGGFDTWVPGTVISLESGMLEVKYDLDTGAKVNKVDVINAVTLAHTKKIQGGNNPHSREVAAWVWESAKDAGIITCDGSPAYARIEVEDDGSDTDDTEGHEASAGVTAGGSTEEAEDEGIKPKRKRSQRQAAVEANKKLSKSGRESVGDDGAEESDEMLHGAA